MKILNNIEKILDQILKINKFQDYVNRKSSIKCGSYITHSAQNTTIEEVFSEYKFNDIQRNDIVLDIGANVGGFSLFVSKFVKHVYAVEPITTHILQKNIELNKINNISVFDTCLGKGMMTIEWMNTIRNIHGKSLSELIFMCGGHVDFLKCDCEGGEWCIKPEELEGIRRIEAEVHNFDGHKVSDFLEVLKNSGFECDYSISKSGEILVHAFRNIEGL